MDATDYKDVSKPVKRKQSEEHLEESRPAKQGRPSKLSPSQKRKFARLYLYTNVSLDDICRIIGLTQVVVKKRTLQNILRESLSEGYNLLRPQDQAARRKRMGQIEILRASSGIEGEQQRSAGSLITSDGRLNPHGFQDPASFISPLTPANDIDTLTPDERPTQQDHFPDEWQEGDWGENFDLEKAAEWLESADTNAEAPNEPSSSRTHELGRSSGADHIHTANDPNVLQAKRAETPHVLSHPLHEPTKTEAPVSTAFPTTEKLEEILFKLEQIQPLPESSILEDPSSSNKIEILLPPNESRVRTTRPVVGIDQQILSTSSTSHDPAVTDTTLDFISEEQKLDLTMPPPTMSPHMGSDVTYGSSPAPAEPRSTRTFPSLSPFLENLTRYSPAHLADIKNAFRCSKSPARSTFASFGIRTSTEHSCSPLESHTKTKNEFSARLRSKLPGELLTSQYNILRHSPGCPDIYVESFPKRSCDKCHAHFLSSLFDDGRPASGEEQEAFCFRSSSEDLEDLDRFGNTSLHLIAALGPSLKSIEVAMWRHSNINAVNTAGQTFMHLIDPCQVLLCMERLFGILERQGFNFDQRDVYGTTFLHVLVEKAFSFIDHWAEPYVRLLHWKDSTGISREVQAGNLVREARFEATPKDDTALHNKQQPSPDHSNWCDLHEYDDRGTTELHRYLASRNGRLRTSQEKLRKLTPSSNQRNSGGWSPLHVSMQHGNLEATRFLLKNGANVHARANAKGGILATAHLWGSPIPIDAPRYTRIEACKALAIDAGAVMRPSFFDEWDFGARNS